MHGESRSKVCAQPIAPSRAVKIDTGGENWVVQAGTRQACVGISGPSTRTAPVDDLDAGYVGQTGNMILVYGNGATNVPAAYGATITVDDYLMSDTDGRLIVAAADKDPVIAQAREAGASGEIRRVDVIIFELSR